MDFLLADVPFDLPFQLNWLQFAVICLLVFLAGFVDAIAGGGGLISLPAYLIMGVPVHIAIATNKMSSCMGTAVATWRYAKSGFVNWRLAPFGVVCAFIGSVIGANLALLISEDIFRLIMLVVLPLTALYVMRCQSLAGGDDKPWYSFKITALLVMVAALLLGVYDGVYGPGTGTFLILLLGGLAHLPLQEANGITKVINLTTNVAAVLVFLLHGKVVLMLGLVAGLFNIVGSLAGTSCFVQGGAKIARPIILMVLLVFMVRVIWQLMTA